MQPGLFDQTVIDGFRYREDLFSAAEEARFVRSFATLPFKPFEFHGHLGNRRIVSFGFRYDYSGGRLKTAPATPDFLQPLKEIAAAFSGLAVDSFVHALVTEYAAGAGIGWHRDKPMFRNVVALSFLSPCRLRFRRRAGETWRRAAVTVAPRSGYWLSGEARNIWEHSIPPLETLRYSVTFRDFEPGYAGPVTE